MANVSMKIFEAEGDKTLIVTAHVTSIKVYSDSRYEVRLTNGDGVLISSEERVRLLLVLDPQASATIEATVDVPAADQSSFIVPVLPRGTVQEQ